jgi:parallel beta-helix repeat protein
MKSLLLSFILAGLILAPITQATVIYVSGDVSGTWSADSVIVTAEVRVPPGQSLTIEPGVKVLFQVYRKFIVDSAATLIAVGTEVDSIRFDELTSGTRWRGLRFLNSSDDSRLEYCHLTHGYASGVAPDYRGGAIYCEESNPTIIHNTISGNSADGGGGGISCYQSSPTISSNTISRNSAASSGYGGGGILCEVFSSPIISGNKISGNSAYYGGGIYCVAAASPSIIGNVISGNSSTGWGGGICILYNCSPVLSGNSLIGNTALNCGAIAIEDANVTVNNCILWGNSPRPNYQTYGSVFPATYADIQCTSLWPGIGNINQDPNFVNAAQRDYRLQWGSPCIDSGDPNPIYNDPDGTRADMGAFYYDQSIPVRVLLTPYNAPIQIPAAGGSFDYGIQATNIASVAHLVTVWCDITLPSGAILGPTLGPASFTLGAGATLSRLRTQTVTAGAPAGSYGYNAYAVALGDTSEDHFNFVKLGTGGFDGLSGWSNTGESFKDMAAAETAAPPSEFLAAQSFPNPFNPATIIKYRLRDANRIQLRVFDASGRLVETLVNGWREAGEQEVSFDGSLLPSGIYIYRLEAEGRVASGKMLLMK